MDQKERYGFSTGSTVLVVRRRCDVEGEGEGDADVAVDVDVDDGCDIIVPCGAMAGVSCCDVVVSVDVSIAE